MTVLENKNLKLIIFNMMKKINRSKSLAKHIHVNADVCLMVENVVKEME